jgi:hypothetical protein
VHPAIIILSAVALIQFWEKLIGATVGAASGLAKP